MKSNNFLVMRLCETKKNLASCKWYNFSKKKQCKKDLESINSELSSKSAYSISEITFGFIYPLIKSEKIILADITDKFSIDDVGLQFVIHNNSNDSDIKIDYYSTRNHISINALDHSYTVLPIVNRIPIKYRTEWKSLEEYIKETCLECIYKVVDKLNGE